MTFGDQLSELRKDKRYTQKDLADILHMSASSISNYEKGINAPDFDTLCTIAELFDVSTDFLLGLTNVRIRYNTRKDEKVGELNLDKFVEKVLELDKEHRKMMFGALRLIYGDNKNRK